MRSKISQCAKQQDSSFEIRWDSLFEEWWRETETLYLKRGCRETKKTFLFEMRLEWGVKVKRLFIFCLNFNCINALILMGLEWGVKVERLFIFCLNFNCIALI